MQRLVRKMETLNRGVHEDAGCSGVSVEETVEVTPSRSSVSRRCSEEDSKGSEGSGGQGGSTRVQKNARRKGRKAGMEKLDLYGDKDDLDCYKPKVSSTRTSRGGVEVDRVFP